MGNKKVFHVVLNENRGLIDRRSRILIGYFSCICGIIYQLLSAFHETSGQVGFVKFKPLNPSQRRFQFFVTKFDLQ
jgi:hypothetical protein